MTIFMKLVDNKPFGCSEVVWIFPLFYNRKVIKISAIATK